MAAKFYAVRIGRIPGVYTTWEACRQQVEGYPGAVYKSFPGRAEAESYVRGDEEGKGPGDDETLLEAYVDGSYNIATGEFGYGAVLLFGGEEHTLSSKPANQSMAEMRNVAGEIWASSAAMRYALEKGFQTLIIYHDYEGIAKWCTGEWKTNKEGTKAYKAYYDSLKGQLNIRFEKVKGHSHNRYNDMADKLAKQAAGVE